jgi:hypothetical protein
VARSTGEHRPRLTQQAAQRPTIPSAPIFDRRRPGGHQRSDLRRDSPGALPSRRTILFAFQASARPGSIGLAHVTQVHAHRTHPRQCAPDPYTPKPTAPSAGTLINTSAPHYPGEARRACPVLTGGAVYVAARPDGEQMMANYAAGNRPVLAAVPGGCVVWVIDCVAGAWSAPDTATPRLYMFLMPVSRPGSAFARRESGSRRLAVGEADLRLDQANGLEQRPVK